MAFSQKIASYDIDEIRKALVDAGRFSDGKIHYFDEIASTNTWLLEQDAPDGCICLAESQSAGRGRRGKSWESSRSGSILLSLGWRLERSDIRGVSLASGLAVMESLRAFGVQQVELKWPNDILISGKKAGGILVEISALNCVIGIGLNYRVSSATAAKIDQPWTDLASAGVQVDRGQLVVELVKNHDRVLTGFTEGGFAGFADQWNLVDAWRSQPVQVVSGSRVISGVASGVDETGALLIAGDGVVHTIISGEVSLRRTTGGWEKSQGD